jgi:hypothetical protein
MTLRSSVFLGVVFCLFYVISGFVATVNADSFYFVPGHSEIDGCAQPQYDVEVWIGPVLDIQGYSLEMTYASDLYLADVLLGDMFPQMSYALQDTLIAGPVRDTLAVDGACLGCSTDGPGHLFTLRFSEPWPCGLADSLKFIWCLWADSSNDTTYLPGISGTITVSCPTATDITRWGAIKSLYR